jgi:nicotinamide riboside transporter PnuC
MTRPKTTVIGGKNTDFYRPRSMLSRIGQFLLGVVLTLGGVSGLFSEDAAGPWWFAILLIVFGLAAMRLAFDKYRKVE